MPEKPERDYPNTKAAFEGGFNEGATSCIDRVLALEEQNKKYKEALEQYADEENWLGNVFKGQGASGAYDHKGELIVQPAPFAIAKDALGIL